VKKERLGARAESREQVRWVVGHGPGSLGRVARGIGGAIKSLRGRSGNMNNSKFRNSDRDLSLPGLADMNDGWGSAG